MMDEKLDVLLLGQKIGDLVRTAKGTRFQFSEEMVAHNQGSPILSTALPVQAEAFDALRTSSWFSGLLPEDTRLQEIMRFYGVADGDYFNLLANIGWECAGAVEVISPEDRKLIGQNSKAELLLSKGDLAKRLAALPSHPYDDSRTLRVSLGGFQEKLCVIINDENFYADKPGYINFHQAALPLNGSPSTHILKPQPTDRFPGLIYAEAWGMEVARHAADTAFSALLDIDNAPLTLLVKRFDRKQTEAGIIRIHQEDCAQALGIEPGRKYASTSIPTKSDPTYRGVVNLLSNYAADPVNEKRELLRHVFVNLVLGNTDAHAKNYALLHDEETIQLAPLYDVVPTREILPSMLFMGMRIDGRIRIDRIFRENIEAEARSWGLPARVIENTLDEAIENIRYGISVANNLYPEAEAQHGTAALERLKTMLAK